MKYLGLILLFLFPIFALAQKDTELKALRNSSKIKIDGVLDEQAWSNSDCADKFTTYEPRFGEKPDQNTKVCVLYDDNAIYIGARMYDDNPEKILKELTKRDYDNGNTDMFIIQLNPNKDGRNMYMFKLTASNVQTDIRVSDDERDYDWDVVWNSEVKIDKEGWALEIRIPYSAIRFPDVEIQDWSVNFWRVLRRTREISSWNPVRKEDGPQAEQMGTLKGLNDINPPLRLSFYPYLSSSVDFNNSFSDPNYSFSGGLDMKLGISKSHTLDITLIPDFSQVKSDDEYLNLTPFETYYSENRPFFTEGTELFEKLGLFYSRRIGKIPQGYNDVINSADDGDEIIKNPRYSRLINAVKFTGRGENNLGIGILNAITANTYATVKDSEGNTSRILTEPWANYNILVLDQSFNNNSYLNFTNTRVDRPDSKYSSNVAGLGFRLMERKNKFGVRGQGSWSHIVDSISDDSMDGYNTSIELGKLNGKWQYEYSIDLTSDKYDPNDFGFLRMNDNVEHELEVNYNIFEPFWKFNQMSSTFEASYETTYSSFSYKENWLRLYSYAETKNYTSIWADLVLRIGDKFDYYEPREAGRVYKFKQTNSFDIYVSTDYRKVFALDFKSGLFGDFVDRYGFYGRISPRVRINDKLNSQLHFQYNLHYNDYGYVSHVSEEIVFGKRDNQTYTSSLVFNWVFNNKMYMSFDLRHYWSKVDYKDFYFLSESGYVDQPADYSENEDLNYNAFSIDLLYSWNFAPGSYLSFMWKNQIYGSEIIPETERFPSYLNNIENLFDQSQFNSLSVRLIYYLDWQYFN